MGRWDELAPQVSQAAAQLSARWGPPDAGVILGSGWQRLAETIGASEEVPREAIAGLPASSVSGHGGGIAFARLGAASVWLVLGRVHLYEGCGPAEVAHPIRILAAAGARRVLLTCAAGGLLPHDRPGDFALLEDHINLTGIDPLAAIPAERRAPAFLDLTGLYDAACREALGRVLEGSVGLRGGVLAGVTGPSFETAAEVRMLRALGADLASMSVVHEAVLARYYGMRVAGLACISNRGAGAGEAAIDHSGVVEVVSAAIGASGATLARAVRAFAESE